MVLKVKTKDGSFTLLNEEINEHYHSMSGAEEEAMEKFAKPAIKSLKEKNNVENNIVVFDLFFGLGYKSAAFLDLLDLFKGNAEIICIEKDKAVIDEISSMNPRFNNYRIIKEIAKSKEYKNERIKIKLIVGDVLEEIKKLDSKADIVFFDPFSPQKVPELWNVEILSQIYKKMKSNGVLLTYSCAGKVRRTMKELNFSVIDGPVVGRRSPGTIAIK